MSYQKSGWVRRLCGLAAAILVIAHYGAMAQDVDTRVVDAARAGDATKVSTLLDQGADPNRPQAAGATALHWAAHWDDQTMAAALLSAGARVDTPNDFGATPLWLACVNGSAAMVRRLLAAGADANAALPSGETVLMTASRTGSAQTVRLLGAHGTHLDTQESSRGQTALMWAVAQGHPDVVKALVELGADVHLRSTPRARRVHTRTDGFNPVGVVDVTLGGNTAMLFAARQGSVESAMHLLAAGADVNDRAPLGTSALVVAAHSGHTGLATFLLEQGADPNAAEAGYTALHGATLRGDLVLTRALLSAGADPDTRVVQGSPGRRNSPDYVLEHDVVGATAFWLASHFAEPDIMRALANSGADPHVVMEDGTTALMAATRARRRREPGLAANPSQDERLILGAVQVALETGGDVHASDTKGNTALHTAAARRLDTVVQLLADNGASLDAQNADGQTPLAMAGGVEGDAAGDNSTAALLRNLKN